MKDQNGAHSGLLEEFETLTRPRRWARYGKKLAMAAMFCLAVLLCALELLPYAREPATPSREAQAPAPVTVFSAPSDTLESITISLPAEEYTLIRLDDGVFAVLDMPAFSIRQNTALVLWMQCASIPAQQVFEAPADLSAMGLDSTKTYITIRIKDETVHRVAIGSSSPSGGCYARVDGDNKVYMLSDSVADTLLMPVNKLHTLDMPEFGMRSAPASVIIENRKQNARWKLIKTAVRISSSGYELTQPHLLADAGEMASLIESISAMQVTAYVGKQNSVDWGPAEYTITETDETGNELRYVLGRRIDADTVYFTMDAEDVYLMPAKSASFLDTLSAEILADRFLCLISPDQILELTLEEKGKTASWHIRSTEGIYTLNGQKTDEAQFKSFFTFLSSLTIDSVLRQDQSADDISWDRSLVCRGVNGEELHKIQFAAYDNNYDLACRSEDIYVLIEKEKVETLFQLGAAE